jgi:hypothetical protein
MRSSATLPSTRFDRSGPALPALVVVAAALQLAAGAGLAYVAGFASVRTTLQYVHWGWLIAIAGALCVSFTGYY